MKRFWNKVKKGLGCWEWTAFRHPDGYGVFRLDGWSQMAHRVAWALKHGAVPEGMQVLHRCDNPGCVNLDHLFLGTQQDNIRDMREKGRHRYGEKHQSAKLTENDVINIRIFDIPLLKLAKLYGVASSTIRNIKTRQTWRHVA